VALRKFSEIVKLAEKHHGKAGITKLLAEHRGGNAKDLKRSDDRFLAGMSKAVFSAGFSWDVIEKKWPGFEEAFDHFDPHKVAFYADRDIARLLKDTRIVRNGKKIDATIANAHFVLHVAKEHGSFGKFLSKWPTNDQFGLMEYFSKHAQFMGPSATMYFLRFNGWDAFILSADVSKALIREKVVSGNVHSKTNMRAVQSAFNIWTSESGLSQQAVSRTLSYSVGPHV
jgi:3-methyladenine DNA glycosylase Tag